MFAAAGIVGLFVRMVVSLALVLAIVAVAYFAMRHRAGLTGRVNSRFAGRRGAGHASRAERGHRQPRSQRRGARQHVEVLGRVGLTRASSAVVVKFADRVLLVGASETARPTVLAEVDAATWELFDQDAEWTVPVDRHADRHADHLADRHRRDAASGPAARPGFLEALREATVRRA
jgi:flagellar biogenesis protein FliO